MATGRVILRGRIKEETGWHNNVLAYLEEVGQDLMMSTAVVGHEVSEDGSIDFARFRIIGNLQIVIAWKIRLTASCDLEALSPIEYYASITPPQPVGECMGTVYNQEEFTCTD